MKATHTDYKHPRHLRVVDGQIHIGWNIGRGWYETDAICMAPSCFDYARLNKPGLPSWDGDAETGGDHHRAVKDDETARDS